MTGGVLVLERQGSGPLYAPVTDVPATSALSIDAVMAWPDSGTGPEQNAYAGVMILNARGEGYALTCATDGQAQVWAIGIEQSRVTDTYDDAECGASFALGLDVRGTGFNLDTLAVTLPDGEGGVILPGTRQGPFTSAGFVSLEPGSGSVPINVLEYEVAAAR